MKRFLILLAVIPIATRCLAQAPAGPAGIPLIPGGPTEASGTTAAPAPSSKGAAAPSTGAAASSVPLPGQPAGGPTLEKNIPLIPDTVPGGGPGSGHGHGEHGAAAGAAPREAATFKTEDDIRMRFRIRIVQTKAENLPAVRAKWDAAHQAATEKVRRALLADYYNLLFDNMIKMDPTIAPRANNRRTAFIARMRYSRLGDPDNSEDPFAPQPPSGDVQGPNPPEPAPTPQANEPSTDSPGDTSSGPSTDVTPRE